MLTLRVPLETRKSTQFILVVLNLRNFCASPLASRLVNPKVSGGVPYHAVPWGVREPFSRLKISGRKGVSLGQRPEIVVEV